MAELRDLARIQHVQGAILSWESNNGMGYIADQVVGRYNSNSRKGLLMEKDAADTALRSSVRSPGGEAVEVESGYKDGNPFHCKDRTRKERVPIEELQAAADDFALDVYGEKAATLTEQWYNEREALVASLFCNTDPLTGEYSAALASANYASTANQIVSLALTEQWSDAANCDPFGDIKTARLWFAKNSFVTPNTVIIPEDVALNLRETTAYKAEYGDRDLQAVANIDPILRGLRVLIPSAKVENKAGSMRYLWENKVWIGNIDSGAPQRAFRGHAVEVTYTKGDTGVRVWDDPSPDKKTSYVQVMNGELDWIIARKGGSHSGYLLTDVLAVS